ncbi:ribokinase [Geothermobacter ehrlichii]|uniref:Ribokinase n=1 Tax=Geothermobacter ehrlichii TaxID=213224 RepID=A0A5D3WNV3_9BACT|nr:PfkB family carbohydrate kinase [Geothermobacter ehrlichii]TYP00014.1 ribokinase [Geothermobacter ehrlichii]
MVGLGQCCWDQVGLVEQWPHPDAKTELLASCEQAGGPVATALVTLARLGVRTAFFGAVGGDEAGRLIRWSLVAEGVDCRLLQVDPEGESQRAWVIADRTTGKRNIFWKRGARRPFHLTDETAELIAAAKVLLLDDLDFDAALAAARAAREAGVTTVLDGGSLRPRTAELLPLIDHLVVSEKFARQWTGRPEPPAALEPLAAFGGTVTVTAGAEGCWSLLAGEVIHQPAFGVDVIDTTGCGDVFHGGYVFGLLQAWPLPAVLAFASACAALKARGLGGQAAIAGLDETLRFLARETGDIRWTTLRITE